MEYKIGGYDIKELQAVMVTMMREIDRICRENDIHYVLDGGSMLGAIRHNGFIPWDDDLDIMMPRDDYDKFLSIADSMLAPKYCFECIENTKEYPYNFGKVRSVGTVFREQYTGHLPINQGIYIDVFPMDYIDTKHRLKLKVIKRLIVIYTGIRYAKLRISKRIRYKIFAFLPLNFVNKRVTALMKYHLENKTQTVEKLCHQGPNKPPIGIELFYDVENHIFEDAEFKIPKGYDAFLCGRYGDYMQCPPIEKRVPCHDVLEVKL